MDTMTDPTKEAKRLQNARMWLDDNRQVVEEFASLLRDVGIQTQMVDAVSRELFGKTVSKDGEIPDDAVSTPADLFRAAVSDLMNVGIFGDISFEFDSAVDSAASLHWLARYARTLDPDVFPRECIPDESVVGAALLLFHHERKLAEAIETTES